MRYVDFDPERFIFCDRSWLQAQRLELLRHLRDLYFGVLRSDREATSDTSIDSMGQRCNSQTDGCNHHCCCCSNPASPTHASAQQSLAFQAPDQTRVCKAIRSARITQAPVAALDGDAECIELWIGIIDGRCACQATCPLFDLRVLFFHGRSAVACSLLELQ